MSHSLPEWAEQMTDLFRSGSVAQFLIHGNIFDVVPTDDASGKRLLSVKAFLESVMFRCWKDRKPYDDAVYMNSLHRRGSGLALDCGKPLSSM